MSECRHDILGEDDVQDGLERRPKFNYDPASSHPQLLAMVREVGSCVVEQDWEGAVSGTVDCLLQTKQGRDRQAAHAE
ncbi:uncharacterized protein LOC144145882 isoform X2 [Haemaphysalis longicornis]